MRSFVQVWSIAMLLLAPCGAQGAVTAKPPVAALPQRAADWHRITSWRSRMHRRFVASTVDVGTERFVNTRSKSFIAEQFDRYTHALAVRPLSTKIVTAIVLNIISDLIGQGLIGDGRIVLQKSIAFVAAQSFILTPMVHYIFNALEKWGDFVARATGKWAKPFAMVMVDQTCSAPIVFSSFFFTYHILEQMLLGLPGGLSVVFSDAFAKAAATIWPTMLTSWKVWPVVNYLNFRFIPLDLRLPFVSAVSCAFNVFLSIMASK
uniref:Peroxisomal membrane protein MPV17 n=1 Tax=Pinguiococcus pyrenoidosus TaxID=172671 RepID=A0A7R9U0X5_9STRA|mmetsp:Transcript_10647/g.40079  ORF Transcript_10647/g.40079 Transcript_10647/m.40079 type:complete len:263 (+) Transcript_10647:113-901(+)